MLPNFKWGVLALLASLFFLQASLYSHESGSLQDSGTGTLVVTYQTGLKGERLDRIRFWLKHGNRQELYPKRAGFVDDHESQTRTVAIEELSPGQYTLYFLVPNKDALFEEIPAREVTITENKTVKVDQQIKPRYASLKAKVQITAEILLLDNFPQIILRNQNGQLISQSNTGSLEVHHLIPGRYTLYFEEIAGYEAPTPISLVVSPKEDAGPIIGLYHKL